MKIYWTEVQEIIKESKEVYTYILELPEGFTWEEGSFTHFALAGFNEGEKPNRDLIRHMSISTVPSEKSIGITTRITEDCSIFKEALEATKVGDSVALFKTRSNVPLKRENKSIYLLSSGVGLATFRPLVLEYKYDREGIDHVYSLNIESSGEFLFRDIFTSGTDITAKFVQTRDAYYEHVGDLAVDKEAYYYVVGSDEFLRQNIAILRERGIAEQQIMLDKHVDLRTEYFV